jgi:hypothetical protein
LAQFLTTGTKTNKMVPVFTSSVTKKLVLQYVMENINYRKRSLYLQEIIAIGKSDKVWNNALALFFDVPFTARTIPSICKN